MTAGHGFGLGMLHLDGSDYCPALCGDDYLSGGFHVRSDSEFRIVSSDTTYMKVLIVPYYMEPLPLSIGTISGINHLLSGISV